MTFLRSMLNKMYRGGWYLEGKIMSSRRWRMWRFMCGKDYPCRKVLQKSMCIAAFFLLLWSRRGLADAVWTSWLFLAGNFYPSSMWLAGFFFSCLINWPIRMKSHFLFFIFAWLPWDILTICISTTALSTPGDFKSSSKPCQLRFLEGQNMEC